jgi:hypothetical protein
LLSLALIGIQCSLVSAATLYGKVSDVNGQGVSGATVSVEGQNLKAKTSNLLMAALRQAPIRKERVLCL